MKFQNPGNQTVTLTGAGVAPVDDPTVLLPTVALANNTASAFLDTAAYNSVLVTAGNPVGSFPGTAELELIWSAAGVVVATESFAVTFTSSGGTTGKYNVACKGTELEIFARTSGGAVNVSVIGSYRTQDQVAYQSTPDANATAGALTESVGDGLVVWALTVPGSPTAATADVYSSNGPATVTASLPVSPDTYQVQAQDVITGAPLAGLKGITATGSVPALVTFDVLLPCRPVELVVISGDSTPIAGAIITLVYSSN